MHISAMYYLNVGGSIGLGPKMLYPQLVTHFDIFTKHIHKKRNRTESGYSNQAF